MGWASEQKPETEEHSSNHQGTCALLLNGGQVSLGLSKDAKELGLGCAAVNGGWDCHWFGCS